MRITERDRRLLVRLAQARWLTSRQVSGLCFPGVSVEMARRRLRLLGANYYVVSSQSNPMAETLYTLGPKGRDLLLERGWPHAIRLERKPPKNLEHFLGINDIRVAVAGKAEPEGFVIRYFFACWELQQHGWAYPLIPDAACNVECQGASSTTLFEYDRGAESVRYVVSKLAAYADGLPGFPFGRVVIITDPASRAEELRDYASSRVDLRTFYFMDHATLLGPMRLAGILC